MTTQSSLSGDLKALQDAAWVLVGHRMVQGYGPEIRVGMEHDDRVTVSLWLQNEVLFFHICPPGEEALRSTVNALTRQCNAILNLPGFVVSEVMGA